VPAEQPNHRERKIARFKEIILSPLVEYQAVDLLLSHCSREIKADYDFGVTKLKHGVHRQLQMEQKLIYCSGLPFYLIMLAKELQEFFFSEIEVIKNKGDNLQGTPGHSRQKKKQNKVIIRHKNSK